LVCLALWLAPRIKASELIYSCRPHPPAGSTSPRTPAVFRIQLSNGKLKFSALVNTPTPADVEFGPIA